MLCYLLANLLCSTLNGRHAEEGADFFDEHDGDDRVRPDAQIRRRPTLSNNINNNMHDMITTRSIG